MKSTQELLPNENFSSNIYSWLKYSYVKYSTFKILNHSIKDLFTLFLQRVFCKVIHAHLFYHKKYVIILYRLFTPPKQVNSKSSHVYKICILFILKNVVPSIWCYCCVAIYKYIGNMSYNMRLNYINTPWFLLLIRDFANLTCLIDLIS